MTASTNQNLWAQNPALIQMLGLCPLLAVSNSALNGVYLGLATLVVLVVGNGCISLCRHWIAPQLRLPTFMLILGTTTTTTELGLQTLDYELYTELGLFIPLIITNCTLLARAEAFASKQALLPTVLDSVSTGLGFLWVLVLIGAIRGTLATSMTLMALPAGAFFVFGLLVALQAWFEHWRWQKKRHAELNSNRIKTVNIT